MLTRIFSLVAALLLAPASTDARAYAYAPALELKTALPDFIALDLNPFQEKSPLSPSATKGKSLEIAAASIGRENYLRARYMDPGAGRFVGMDPFNGCLYCVRTLNKYTYAIGSPVNEIDPSGLITLTELNTALNEIGALRTAAIHQFRNGSVRVGGQLIKQMGKRAQDLIEKIIRDCLKVSPTEFKIPRSRRSIDFLIQLADRLDLVEVKSGLPARIAGPAMRRLAAQLRDAQRAGLNPKVVFVSAFEPERMEKLIRFLSRNGTTVTPADVINGGVDFAKWLGEVFTEVCIEQ